MAETMSSSIDCPDCQFQLLQQQSQASSTDLPENQQVHHEILQSSRSQTESLSLWSEARSKQPVVSLASQETTRSHPYQLGHSSRMANSSSSSASCLNMYPYSSELGNFHMTTGSCNNPSLSMPDTSTITPLSTPQQVDTIQTAATTIEPCDYNGYCSTCAVLELPTNDKYYRHSNSRPHVFPPIFFAQGASSVIPCFSPIPDCPWGNEYNLYGYTNPYPQPTSTPSVSNEYYGSSNVIANSNTIMSSADASNLANLQPLNSVSYSNSISYNNNNNNNTSTTRTECRMEPGASGSDSRSISKPTPEPLRKSECPAGSIVSISNESPCSSEEETENDSLCGSDGSESVLSEDRELISVVEEDENDRIKDTFYPVRSGNTCWICYNPLGMSVCSSPQLAKILENIDGEITAEDLDISVSSGDIEIGGIDDEVKDFNHKKDHTTSQAEISLSRLYTLTGISSQSRPNFESQRSLQPDSDIVSLCFRCEKLVSLADSLERQLTVAVSKLHQQLLASHSTQDMLQFNPVRFFRDDNIPNLFLVNQRCERMDKSTQIGDETNVESTESPKHIFTTDNNDKSKKEVKSKIINTPQISPKKISENESSSEESEECSISENDEASVEMPVSSMDLNDNKTINTQEFTHCLEISNSLAKPNVPSSEEPELNDNCLYTVPISANIEENTEIIKNRNLYEKTSNQSPPVIKIRDDGLPNLQQPNGQTTNTLFASDVLFVPQSVPKTLPNIPLTCGYCQRKFSTKSNLTAHDSICKFKASHKSNDVLFKVDKMAMKCSNCGIGFRSAIRRKMHLEQGCKATVFECEYCSKIFSKNSELKVHLQLHKGEKSFKCDVCGACFSTKGNQIAHLRTHSNNKSFPCNLCEQGFNRRYALQMHINRHNGVKPFSCALCNKTFSDPSNLKNHTKRSHRVEKEIPS